MIEREKITEKIDNTKDWFKSKWDELLFFCHNNKELIVVLGPVVIGSGVELIKIITRKSNVNEEKRLKDKYIYDRSNGHYYELRKKPTSKQWVQIDERKSQGQSLGEILNDMRLLK